MAKRPATASKRTGAPTTPDPVEIAMEAEAHDAAPDSPARAVLVKHGRLLDIQIASAKTSLWLKFLGGGVAVLAVVIAAVVVWSASQYRGLVIDAFSVPPEMETVGLNGSAVATRMLDKLGAMQKATISARAANTYANGWGDTVQVEIPQTGVSVGELWKFLREWLGEEVRITGEVVRTPTGLRVTARAGGEPAQVFEGGPGDLEALLDKAAEAVFADTQPYRYAVYLSRSGETQRSLAAYEALTKTGDAFDRKWAYAGWSLGLQNTLDFEGAIEKAQAALAIDPHFGLAQANLGGVLGHIGDEEGQYRQYWVSARDLRRRPQDYGPGRARTFADEMEGDALMLEGDFARAAAAYERARTDPSGTGRDVDDQLGLALVGAHEVSRGLRIIRADDAASEIGLTAADLAATVNPWVRANWAEAAAAMERIEAALSADASMRMWMATQFRPIRIVALARTGRLAEAEALAAAQPGGCYYCLLARGEVAAIAGRPAEADRWFAEGVRRGPSLPLGYLRWGQAKLARGDRAGAIALFQQAAEKGPRWADPLKLWGDALAAGGDHAGAMRKYRQAAQRAPRWGGLMLAWGRSLAATGRADEARAKYRAAAGLDLTAAERVEVNRRLAQTSPAR